MATFLTVDDFPQLRPLLDNFDVILQEFEQIRYMAMPWVETYLHDGGWDVFGLVMGGDTLRTAELAPGTMAVVSQIPDLFIAGFSILRARSEIKPHVGYTDKVWRAHFPLITDGQASITVGEETHHWRVGEIVVFDDTIRHFATNPSDRDRAILMVDFYKR